METKYGLNIMDCTLCNNAASLNEQEQEQYDHPHTHGGVNMKAWAQFAAEQRYPAQISQMQKMKAYCSINLPNTKDEFQLPHFLQLLTSGGELGLDVLNTSPQNLLHLESKSFELKLKKHLSSRQSHL